MVNPERRITLVKSEELSISSDLIKALSLQLEKDLQSSFEELRPQDYLNQIAKTIEISIERNDLGQILYKIDIPEAESSACMKHENPIECLAVKVLTREVQKVVFRQQYGQSS